MPKLNVKKSFENWMQAQEESHTSREEQLRVAFEAGCSFAEKSKYKTYRFKTGRWVVTVEAKGLRDAKKKASARLTRRMEKLLAKPPSGGWSLQLVGSE
jgi:ketosteroid isomerase-like protein